MLMTFAKLRPISRHRSGLDGLSLRTARLTLRPFHEHDASFILALFSDEGFMRFASTPRFTSIDQAHAVIARDAAKRATGERLRLGMERTDDGVLVGYCDLFNIDRDFNKAELGYGLLTAHRGFGYMHEALSALLNWAFNERPLNRVTAEIDPANTNSAKTLTRLGFSKQGQLGDGCIVDGVVSDSVFYALCKQNTGPCPTASLAIPTMNANITP